MAVIGCRRSPQVGVRDGIPRWLGQSRHGSHCSTRPQPMSDRVLPAPTTSRASLRQVRSSPPGLRAGPQRRQIVPCPWHETLRRPHTSRPAPQASSCCKPGRESRSGSKRMSVSGVSLSSKTRGLAAPHAPTSLAAYRSACLSFRHGRSRLSIDGRPTRVYRTQQTTVGWGRRSIAIPLDRALGHFHRTP